MTATLGGFMHKALIAIPWIVAAMNLTVGNDVALAFGLLFARRRGVIGALPMLLGVALPVRIRLMLAAVIAAALMPLAGRDAGRFRSAPQSSS